LISLREVGILAVQFEEQLGKIAATQKDFYVIPCQLITLRCGEKITWDLFLCAILGAPCSQQEYGRF
jgi:hypothetical protein